MSDLISRKAAIDKFERWLKVEGYRYNHDELNVLKAVLFELRFLPSAQSKIIHCIDCKFYTPMNRETKTGICNLTMHQNFGDEWYCAGAERRADE